MKGVGKSFTQIYNLVGLSIPVMAIVILLYLGVKAAKSKVCFQAFWEVIVKVHVMHCGRQWVNLQVQVSKHISTKSLAPKLKSGCGD